MAEGGPKILEEGASPVVLLLLLLCADEDIERESLPELKCGQSIRNSEQK